MGEGEWRWGWVKVSGGGDGGVGRDEGGVCCFLPSVLNVL